MPLLRIIRENGKISEIPLLENEISIGRTDENDIVLDDSSVSRKHARLTKKDNTYIIKDLGSHNGTIVNDHPVDSIELNDGDHILVGRNALTFISQRQPSLVTRATLTVSEELKKIAPPEVPEPSKVEVEPPPPQVEPPPVEPAEKEEVITEAKDEKPPAVPQDIPEPSPEEDVKPAPPIELPPEEPVKIEEEKPEIEPKDIPEPSKVEVEVPPPQAEPPPVEPPEKEDVITEAKDEEPPAVPQDIPEPGPEEDVTPAPPVELPPEEPVKIEEEKPEIEPKDIPEPSPVEAVARTLQMEIPVEEPPQKEKIKPAKKDEGFPTLESLDVPEDDLIPILRKVEIFSIYSDEELAELIESIKIETFDAGETVCNQGDPGDKLYIVISGKIRIVKTDEKEINLGVRVKGDHFGETALITGKPRNATARAAEDSSLISIDGDSFNDFLLGKPKLREYFDKFIKFSSISQFIKTSSALAIASTKDVMELTTHFKAEFYNKGETVILQGAEADNFYLIESGMLKVVRWDDKKPKTINFLHQGDFFGEKALFEETKRFADVVCLTDCQLLSLSREDFNKIIGKSPKIKKVIEDRIKTYSGDRAPVAYTEVIKQELAALKPISIPKKADGEDIKLPKERKKRLRKLSSFYSKKIRFPFIEQYDQMTCGTTCIMMIAKYYGKSFSSSRLRDLAHVDLSGASLANLASAAEQLGFSTRGMKIDYDTLSSIHLPCIVHWRGYHYIVVYKITDKYVWVSDPALGHRKYKKDFFNKNWNGITMTLEPTVEFKKQKDDESSFKNFMKFVIPYKMILLEIFIASLILNLFGLASPIFTQNIVDKVLTHNNVSMLNVMLLGMLIVLVFRILTMIVRQYLIVHTGMKIDLRMLVQFYKHLLSLPLGYFKVRKVGDFIARFGENMKIRNFLTETALTIVLDTILIVVYLSLMFYYNVKLTGMVLIFIPIFVAVTLIFTPMLKKLNINAFTARAESQSHLIESIHGIDTIKATNTEYQTRWRWEDKFIKSLNVDFKLINTAMYFNSLGDFVGSLSTTLILWYGAHTVMNGGLSVGELMAFMALLGSVITPINRIITTWDNIQEALVSVDRLNDVLTAQPEFADSQDMQSGIVMKNPQGKIDFEGVYFRYGGEDDPYILSNINLTVQSGEKLAIVGRSGSGKTTLVKLIALFHDVTDGKISIDGMDIRNINLSNLRKMIGFVLQESFLFNGSIRENITLGDPEETMEKIIEAAKLANAHDFITNLALGYETRIGESGLQLSGGQRQRISIARVLYAKPKIIIFDEATSSLDTESEQAIQKNMETILSDKSSIIIAHRLSTVRDADNIIVLDNGEIIEQGNHEELMQKEGLYHYLNHQQLNL